MNGVIKSEDFYIWDNWGYMDDKRLHIHAQYCEKSKCKNPEDRYWNVRIEHFISDDYGETFEHIGTAIDVSSDKNLFDAYNIWSGCAVKTEKQKVLTLYTGLKYGDHTLASERKYALQSIGMALSTDDGITFQKVSEPLICPNRDYDKMNNLGYYLGPQETLGMIDDPDGTFMCLRDPEVFIQEGIIHLIFGCKVRTSINGKLVIKNGVGHGILHKIDSIESFELLPPIFVSNEMDYNQLELPGMIYYKRSYYLIISTTKLDYIGQPDTEVDKTVRMYKTSNLVDRDAWQPYGKNGRHIILDTKKDQLYGPKLIHNWSDNGVFFLRPFIVGKTFAPRTIGISLQRDYPILI